MHCRSTWLIHRWLILLFCVLQCSWPSQAQEPIRSAFGQTLGEAFDPAKATEMAYDGKVLLFSFHLPKKLPVLSRFRVLVAPLTYRIYSIQAEDDIRDPKECIKWARALFHTIYEKYYGEKYATQAFEYEDKSGQKLEQQENNRLISASCNRESRLVVVYLDHSLRQAANDEQREWDQLYADYVHGLFKEVMPRVRQLADSGNMQAQVLLGLMYRKGQGVREDAKIAEDYYRRAAKNRYVVAWFNLGTLYIAQSRYQEAESWLKMAAESDETKSQFNLGQLYLLESSLRNEAEAFQWFLRAAEHGHLGAQYQTCHMYSAGDGVVRNEIMAYKWCDIAATSGQQKAAENRDHIAKRMTPKQVETARQLSEQWLARRGNP